MPFSVWIYSVIAWIIAEENRGLAWEIDSGKRLAKVVAIFKMSFDLKMTRSILPENYPLMIY